MSTTRRLQFTNLEFSENEKPTSIKFNHWLSLNEKNRLLLGPYSVAVLTGSNYPNTCTGIWLELVEDIMDVGGLYVSGTTLYSNLKFDILYQNQLTITSFYITWEKCQFFESGGRYITNLTSGTNTYPRILYLGSGSGNVNISGAQSYNFYCTRSSWS